MRSTIDYHWSCPGGILGRKNTNIPEDTGLGKLVYSAKVSYSR